MGIIDPRRVASLTERAEMKTNARFRLVADELMQADRILGSKLLSTLGQEVEALRALTCTGDDDD
jgi:hypothetical protein